jgi:hypothetical protein
MERLQALPEFECHGCFESSPFNQARATRRASTSRLPSLSWASRAVIELSVPPAPERVLAMGWLRCGKIIARLNLPARAISAGARNVGRTETPMHP